MEPVAITNTLAIAATSVVVTTDAFAVAGTSVAASGNTADIAVAGLGEVAVSVSLTALSGGVAPTVTFSLQRKDQAGTYSPIWTGAALSAVGGQTVSIGRGMETARSIGRTVRLAWVTTGGPTTATASLSVQGKQ